MRGMPTFGRDRIRRFWDDVSSRKKLAARDYEAFLMVSGLPGMCLQYGSGIARAEIVSARATLELEN